MDWTKLNLREIHDYCETKNPAFRTYTFDLQLEIIVLIFHACGVERFAVEDVQEFYREMRIPKPQSTGVVRPTPKKIRATAARLNTVRIMEDGGFEIVPAETGLYLPFDSEIYRNYLK